jgi:uncharacterized protein with von Willebrand factor type A (vWA) domain
VIDAAGVAARFDRALRERGVDAGTRRALTFAETLTALPPGDLPGLYWRARVSMLPRIEDLDRFHAAFVATFGARDEDRPIHGLVDAPPPVAESAPGRTAIVASSAAERAAAAVEMERRAVLVAASLEERLRDRDFDAVSDDERDAMLRLIARVRVSAEPRRSRRRLPHAHGDRFDFRGTLRAARRTGGELARRRTTRRRDRLRPLVFLIDVSGSMEPFARALLHYARVCALARPRVRAFAFATRLTDLTPILRDTSDAELMAAIAGQVRDYGGGTRIGASMHAFNERYARRGAARGGTVVIVSDGWEREDPALVRSEMERLRRLVRRIVWINPHKRHPAYEPLVRGMAAALPYLDAFVSGHTVRTLEAVADAIEGNAGR